MRVYSISEIKKNISWNKSVYLEVHIRDRFSQVKGDFIKISYNSINKYKYTLECAALSKVTYRRKKEMIERIEKYFRERGSILNRRSFVQAAKEIDPGFKKAKESLWLDSENMCDKCNSTNVQFIQKGDHRGCTHKALICSDCWEEIVC